MKRALIFVAISITLITNLNAQKWQALPNAPGSYRFDDIYFLNPQKGWAINLYYGSSNPVQFGQVYTTNNAGNTWQKIYDSSKTLIRCVGFADKLNGWFGNIASATPYTKDINPLYRTIDGGIHWTPVLNIPDPKPAGICGISIVTDSVIYAYGRYYGPAFLIKSIDKGATWTSQDMSTYATGLVDGHFFNKDTGFLFGSYDKRGLILSTFNGGFTWKVRYLSTRLYSETAWKISFPSRNIGYATIENLGGLAFSPNYIAKTTDGGLTWTDISFIPNYSIQGIGFINDSVGWVGGSSSIPINYKTTNGGKTWLADDSFGVSKPPYNQSPKLGYSINRFRSFGDSLVYACGNTIYKYKKNPLSVDTLDISKQFDASPKHFDASPNPFSEQLIIRSTLLKNNCKVLIYNSLGQLEKEIKNINSESIIIKRDNLRNGIYLLYVIQDNQIKVIQKLEVESQ